MCEGETSYDLMSESYWGIWVVLKEIRSVVSLGICIKAVERNSGDVQMRETGR